MMLFIKMFQVYYWSSLLFWSNHTHQYGLWTYLSADVCGQGSRVLSDVGVCVWINWPAEGRLCLTIML